MMIEMERTPEKFKRVAAAFNEAYSRCESSGSEHFLSLDNDDHDLSDLVNSFIEEENPIGEANNVGKETELSDTEEKSNKSSDNFYETKQKLEELINSKSNDEILRAKICTEMEIACRVVGEKSSFGFKRKLMSSLRDRGFDAGLCKSRWERFGRHPAGVYEYIDVNLKGTRYIIEVGLSEQFEVARSSIQYATLLDIFPRILVVKPEELKQIVRLMCNAIRVSIKGIDMHVAPWRRLGYMQAKWFNHYRRTVNESSKSIRDANSVVKCSIGFEAMPVEVSKCRDDFGRNCGLKVGFLTAAFNDNVE